MMTARDYKVFTGSGDWSALYIDGELSVVGDHYLIDERLRAELGVQEVYSDDFLRGGDDRSDVAPTLVALEQWQGRERELRSL